MKGDGTLPLVNVTPVIYYSLNYYVEYNSTLIHGTWKYKCYLPKLLFPPIIYI